MFEQLERINAAPKPFEFYTAADLWTDEYISGQMLKFHLDEGVDAASRSSSFIDRSVDWIVSHFDIGAGKKVADFGCGPGLYTTRLARRHAVVTGIDFSKRSIRYAKETADRERLPIHYVTRNYLDFKTEDRFHLIIMIMCDFCALSPNQRREILSKFHALLEPSGSVLLDVYSLAAFSEREEQSRYEANLLNGFWSPDKYYGFLNTFKYEKEKLVLDKYTIIEARRSRTIYNWLQCFSPEDLEREFKECGFSIEGYYSDVAGTPFSPQSSEFAVIANRT
jgi:cyclopropane fatty-acyl-phospholipid synthase-like methyltransferase